MSFLPTNTPGTRRKRVGLTKIMRKLGEAQAAGIASGSTVFRLRDQLKDWLAEQPIGTLVLAVSPPHPNDHSEFGREEHRRSWLKVPNPRGFRQWRGSAGQLLDDTELADLLAHYWRFNPVQWKGATLSASVPQAVAA